MANTKLSSEDRNELLKLYGKKNSDEFSDEELNKIFKDYNENKLSNEQVKSIIAKYDISKDGKLDVDETKSLKHELSFQETGARYAGYTAVFARSFRYLAFTSDFGEALRPVVSARIVTSTYGIAFGYCFVDIGWEAYKLRRRGYKSEKNHPMSLTQCIVERATFHSVASLALPAFLIHSTVDIAKKITRKFGRFTRLAVIPLLPLYLDHPVESSIEWCFERYGPWANKAHKD
jgi:fission process protein 1